MPTSVLGRILEVLAVLALGSALWGCAADSDTESVASDGTPTKAEFIREGDAICGAQDDRLAEAFEARSEETSAEGLLPDPEEQVEEITAMSLPPFRREVRELRELKPPKQDRAEIEAILTELEHGIAELEKNPAHTLVVGAESPFTEPNNRARKYGFRICGG
jgi:hypothetical protein